MLNFRFMLNRTVKPLPPASSEHLIFFDSALVGLFTLAALGAYVVGPVQRFMSNSGLFIGALFVALGLIPGWILRRKDIPVATLWVSAFLVVGGIVTLFFAGLDAVKKSNWNDRRCLRIQSAMFQPTPQTRTDLPELFSALGCRPQGTEPEGKPANSPLVGPPPTKERIEAYDELVVDILQNEPRLEQPELKSDSKPDQKPKEK